jgi:Calcineurin-like phosphoesterase
MRRLVPSALPSLFLAVACGSSGNAAAPGDPTGPAADAGASPIGHGDASATDASPPPPDAEGGITTPPDAGGPGTPLSFVVVGCNRLDKGDLQPNKNPSSANVAQLQRTFAEVAALSPAPKYFFFAGDMVYGLTNETDLQTQLVAWLALYDASPLPAAGVTLVPIPGNHESETKTAGAEVAYAAAETAWLSVMGARIKGSNGPPAGGADGLATDQSRLTYSFDDSGVHFVVMNTDPVGADYQVPVKWISADVAAARGAGAKHLFAIGHKPAYPAPTAGATEGLSMFPTARDALWSALEGAQAEAMISAHNHLWYKTRPNKTWQIVAGNGGSSLENGVTGTDAFFGFTHVAVAADGSVKATSYGRDLPAAGYNAPAPAATYPTTVRDAFDVTWK